MCEFEYSFTWKIYNFLFCERRNGDSISRTLLCDNFRPHLGLVSLYPNGIRDVYSSFVSFQILICKTNPVIFQKCEIKAIGASGKTLKTHELNNFSPNHHFIELECCDFVPIKDVVEDAESRREDTLTICCKLSGKHQTQNMSEEHFMSTEIGVDRLAFTMKISTGQTVTHPIHFESKRKYDLSLTESRGDLKVAFSKQDSGIESLYIDCTFTLLLTGLNYKTKKYSEKVKCLTFERDSKCEFLLKVLSREYKAFLTQHQSGFTLIHCELNSSNGFYFHFDAPKNDPICTPNDAILPLPITATKVLNCLSLQENLRSLFNNKKLSDVKFLVEDETIEAHKNILIARSPVFAAMFDHQDTMETSSGVINIVDTDAHTLKLFLQFLYTDAVDEMNHDVATKLMMVAEKYQVLSLKEKCAEFLKNEITLDNVCEMLTLADAVNHENLKSESVEYIVANSAKILSSPQWVEWMKNNMQSTYLIFSKLTLNHSSTTTNASGMN